MLTKILFTVVVIAVVYFTYRGRSQTTTAKPVLHREQPPASSISPRTLAYIFIALLVAISCLIFVISWHEQNRIVNIRVISADGTSVNYQARRKTIEGREFVTLDGRDVALGTSDRIEMIEE